MESTHFPGYGRCTTCKEIVSEKEVHNHILNCRKKSFNEKQLCNLCNKQIDSKQFQQHVQNCNQQTISSKSTLSSNKQCPLCQKLVEDLASHCLICQNDENNNNGYQTPRAQTPTDKNIQTEIINSKNKQCLLCSQQIDQADYENHLASCSNDNQQSFTNKNNSQIEDNSPSRQTISKEKQTKQCILCSKQIDQSEFQDHVASCSNDDQSSFTNQNNSQIKDNLSKRLIIPKEKQTKLCLFCSKQIDQSEYEDHVASCSNDDQQFYDNMDTINSSNEKRNTSQYSSQTNENSLRKSKRCGLCSESFDESEYQDHVQFCSSEQSTNDYSDKNYINNKKHQKKNVQKQCIICFQSIDESEYINHVQSCSSEENTKRYSHNDINNNKIHKQTNSSSRSSTIERNDYQTNSFDQLTTKNENRSSLVCSGLNKKSRQDCIICFKSIDLSEYENHVLACVAQTENESYNSTTNNNLQCLTCKRSINKEDNNCQEMACHSRHNHCLKCLRHSMEEFARNRETPVCHKTLCDYELSRHDISSIPLERRLSDRLLKLVKGQQRPLCPKCNFYIDINDNENLDEHIESCGELIPCEYCQLPYPFNQLENHARQCRHEQISLNEKLINFILIRTKYPFTKEQIRIFIQQQNKNHRNKFDPLSIIEALAIFGPIFPYEIPTRECGICMECRPYDDIYVFDCEDSHKLCYGCYYQSCQSKMNDGQILTCALCTHLLKDGELNQLKIPNDQLQIIREYQMKKTFDIYSSRTKGIIKCPSQNCTWVAQADDPNERFRVQCPKCLSEFCSLCNQQYHYRTTCQQLPQITQRWFFWCETERTRYLTMRAQQDAQFANQLEEYNRQSKENNDRNKDLRRRYDELMNDEQYKAQNCRLCPSCKRVVQRLEGCDSMICGQDAHGGNLQSGCGTKFNWAQAKAYTAAATQQPKQTILDLPKPDNPVVHHVGVKCDHCQNDVNGIRFDCVHCPALTYCENCEQQATLMHSRENQAYQQQQHVFKLIMIPEEEATQF